MKKSLLLTILASSLMASEASNVQEMFQNAAVSGNIKYYYIQTDKDFSTAPSTSAKANSIGGKLSFETASLYGVRAKATFMTTNGFALNSDVAKVDTSILGKDNGVYYGDAQRAKDSFSVLGEAYLAYGYENLELLYGRKVLHSPLLDAKEVRMLPSAVQGAFASYSLVDLSVNLAYLDKFKHRTSDRFTNIIEHALGSDTRMLTGSNTGSVVMADAAYKKGAFGAKVYDYYAKDFINSIYFDASFTQNMGGMKFLAAAQYINQKSIGNTDTYLANNTAYADGKINANAYGLKADLSFQESKFTLAYSKVKRDAGKHDSLVLPWDGTPLFTNMITSNNLFQSIYGNALKADSVYIGGSRGIKVAYKQGFGFAGFNGLSTTLAYLNTANSRAGFDKDQKDYNAVIAYKYDKALSIVLKGIWVDNNTGAAKNGIVSQIKRLSQYRVIANYKF